MPKFSYSARDDESRLVAGTITAPDKTAVVKELKKRSLTIIDIVQEGHEKKLSVIHAKGRIRPMDLVVFSRQLATLIDSGVSLIVGLNIIYAQTENPYFKKVISQIKNDIEGGNGLSFSFSKYPHVFPVIFVNMIRAGESSGSLNEILERVSDYFERTENLRRKIKASLTYPVLIVGMAVVILTFLMVKVVPTFKNIFISLGGSLPLPTQILITASDASVRFFPYIVVSLIIISLGLTRYIHTESGRLRYDAFRLKLPVFGLLVSKIAISRFARTLATLVKSGVSILEAFDISGKVSGNKVIEIATEQIRINMRAGETISGPMEETGKFPPFVVKMISVGEQTGELEKMLTKVADYYEDQVNDALTEMTSLIEPVIISFLGVTIGFVVVAMFLPIFKLTQLIGK
jgi:type IV pilus assembly protein PilC